jgi:hypothetical protein
LPTNAPSLTEAQRRALALGDDLRWCILVEAGNSSQVMIRTGQPARVLVLCLGERLAEGKRG